MTKREQEVQAAGEHELGCFEWALELVVEAAARQGVELAGDIDETWNEITNAERAHMWMNNGKIECHCTETDVAGVQRAFALVGEE